MTAYDIVGLAGVILLGSLAFAVLIGKWIKGAGE